MSDDPRRIQGEISGPGGPYDQGQVVIDLTHALILEGCEVAIVGAVRQGRIDENVLALTMNGRINKTEERLGVMVLLNSDGAAGLVTQLIGVASRAGFREEFMKRVSERMDEMPL